jgi:hypothetical protein
VVILASPKTVAHSLKLRFVVMMTLVRSYNLLRRWIVSVRCPCSDGVMECLLDVPYR